jgi:hypothetical protein
MFLDCVIGGRKLHSTNTTTAGSKRGGGGEFGGAEDGEFEGAEYGEFGGAEDGEFGGAEDGEFGGDDVTAEKIRRSNSERASAASATRGVTVTHHLAHEKPRKKRNTVTHAAMDQFVVNVGATKRELSKLIKAATTLPMLPVQAAPPITPIAVESPNSKKSRKKSELSRNIRELQDEMARETNAVEIAKLESQIAAAREQRAALD